MIRGTKDLRLGMIVSSWLIRLEAKDHPLVVFLPQVRKSAIQLIVNAHPKAVIGSLKVQEDNEKLWDVVTSKYSSMNSNFMNYEFRTLVSESSDFVSTRMARLFL